MNSFSGTGPGAQTPDGSSVELYKVLPHFGEAEIIHSAVCEGASILELGAGAGRVTHPLLDLGHAVTAVDFSSEMLAQIHGAETVLADIASLNLERQFDAVVLGSTLVNTPDDELRRRLLTACARHAAPHGVVLVECHARSLLERAEAGVLSEEDGLCVSWLEVRRDGNLVSGTLEHRWGDSVWTQTFSTRYLSEEELTAALKDAGLRFDRWLDNRHSWLAASVSKEIFETLEPRPKT